MDVKYVCSSYVSRYVKNKGSSDGKRELTEQSPRAAAASAEVHLQPCHHKSTEGQSKNRGRGGPAV